MGQSKDLQASQIQQYWDEAAAEQMESCYLLDAIAVPVLFGSLMS